MGSRGYLSAISWSCNGIEGNITELRGFVQEHAPDIMLLQETHLGPGMTFKTPNYFIIRNDHHNNNSPIAIRGMAVCIQNSLSFYTANPPLRN